MNDVDINTENFVEIAHQTNNVIGIQMPIVNQRRTRFQIYVIEIISQEFQLRPLS